MYCLQGLDSRLRGNDGGRVLYQLTPKMTPEPEGSGGRNECIAYKDWIPASAGMTEAKLITS